MPRLLVFALLFGLASTLQARGPRYDLVITQSGYIQYQAEVTCLVKKEGQGLDPSADLGSAAIKQRSLTRSITRRVDKKYGLDRLSEEEHKRMVASYSAMPDTQQRIALRVLDISPSCNTALPPRLAAVMGRDQFIAYMAELRCLQERYPQQPRLPENEAFSTLSNREKDRIVDAYSISPDIYREIRSRALYLDHECKLPAR